VNAAKPTGPYSLPGRLGGVGAVVVIVVNIKVKRYYTVSQKNWTFFYYAPAPVGEAGAL